MTTSKHTHHTAVGSTVLYAGVLTLLTACGGGGNSPASPSAGEYETSAVGAIFVAKATVGHAQNDEAAINPNSIATAIDFAPREAVTNVESVSKYTVNNGVHTIDVDTSAASETEFVTIIDDQKKVKVGATTWPYSRFGLFQDKETNSDGFDTQYTVRTLPYATTQVYSSEIPDPASYNTSGKATGTYTIQGVEWRNFECSVNVTTSVTEASHDAEVSLSNCVDANDNAIGTTGSLLLRKTRPSGDFIGTATTFTATLGTHTMTGQGTYGTFTLGGPNAEEIVGTIVIAGKEDGWKDIHITLAFGAKKTDT